MTGVVQLSYRQSNSGTFDAEHLLVISICHYWSRCATATLAFATLLLQTAHAAPPTAAELQADHEKLVAAADWRPKSPASGSLVFIAPDVYSYAVEDNRGENVARKKLADDLFALAKRAAEAGQSSLAFQWATEALTENPDQADARRVLGFEQHDGQWLTPFEVKMVDAGKIWHPKFGWIAKADVPRYEAGERKNGASWASEKADTARHNRIDEGWQVRTDHYVVTSNKSLAAAAELAERLERLHQVWKQLFAGFCLSDKEVQQLFAGDRQARKQIAPFRVVYHRDRDDYNTSLARKQPRIAETLGIYFDTDREAHFFAGQEEDAGTLYHEAAHQLFQESRPVARRVAAGANFWVIEGVATYFETLAEHRDPQVGLYFTIGEASAGRLPAARERLLVDEFYIPLEQLTKWGKSELQNQPELAKIYSESTGLAAFLMDAEQARYREALVRYLQTVYAGHDSAQTLNQEAGTPYPELDAEYRRFMESLPQ